MRLRSLLPATLLLTAAAAPCLALRPVLHTSRSKAHASTQHADIKHATAHATIHKSVHSAVVTHHEPIGIPSERATEIQTALIQRGYLTGEPSGTWDKETVAAMEKLQGENGWQTKVTPDARALIKLGLGPNQQQATTQATAQQTQP
jgi:hypothetical protein